MQKISQMQAGQLMKLAGTSLQHLSEENAALKEKNASLEDRVVKFERKERAEKIASMMDEKGIQPEVPYDEKVTHLVENEDLDIVEKAMSLSAPQLKVASVHEDGSSDVTPPTSDDTDGTAAREFEMNLINDSGE